MVFGGVAMGNINAKDAANVAGIRIRYASMPVLILIEASMGNINWDVAVLEVNSVRNVIKKTIAITTITIL